MVSNVFWCIWQNNRPTLDKYWQMVYTAGVEGKANSKQGDVKMKKRELSPIELKKVVELRQLGAKWTEIEQETKVERRAAKRAYEEWERDKKMKEQEAARFRVVAEAFHEHLNDLIRLAESLVSTLHVPEMLRGLDSADEALDQLWMRNIQGELEPFPSSSDERERVVRRNKMLFKSLHDHTREKIRWKALEEWKQAQNNAVQYSKELQLEAAEVIRNNLNNSLGLETRIKTAIGANDVTEKVSDGVRETIWRGILTGKPDQMHVWEGTSLVSKGRVELRFYDGDSDTRLDLYDVELAKEALSMCRQVVTKLLEVKSDLVQKLTDEVSQMKDRTRELEENLDGLVLRPMMMHTRCDLCPT